MTTIADVYDDAQRSVIGSLLIDPEHTVGIAMDAVREEDFRGEYRTVFAAIRAVWLAQTPIDPVTVAERCGAGYSKLLRECMAFTPTAANVAAHCAVVRRESNLQRLRDIGDALTGAMDEADARRALASAETLLMDRPGVKISSVQTLLQDFYRRMDDKAPERYLPWGIRDLDEQLTAERGDFIVLGADSSVGKTALAAQFAWHMASKGLRVGFFSLETSGKKLADRLVAQRARLEMDAIKHRQFSDQAYRDVLALASAAGKVPLDVIEAGGCSVSDLRAVTVAHRYDVIFVDYLQLLTAPGRDRWEIVTEISIELHTMAQALGVAVVALSQLTPPDKTAKAKRQPTKDDLRESRQLKQDADLVILLSLNDPSNSASDRWLRVDKNKDGPQLDVALRFDPKHMDFIKTDTRRFLGKPQIKRPTFQDLPDDGQEEIPFEPR